jgi:hypothetical protein
METKAICAALAKAQAKMGRAVKDSTNSAFKSKYANLFNVSTMTAYRAVTRQSWSTT